MGISTKSRLLAILLGSIATLSAEVALATVPHGILAGTSVKWYGSSGSGAGANAIYVSAGNGYINGTSFNLAATGSLAVPTGLKGGVTLAASTAYYLYVICASSPTILLSTVAPASDGRPSSNLSDANDCGTNVADELGVFVGSILTDASKNVVPFARNGDQVLLMPSVTTGITEIGLSNREYSVPAGGGAACSNVSSPQTYSEFPESASALILDLHVHAPNGTSFAILQPSTASGCGADWNPEWINDTSVSESRERVIIKGSQSCVSSTCTTDVYYTQGAAGNVSDYVVGDYVGYIEKIQLLNFL